MTDYNTLLRQAQAELNDLQQKKAVILAKRAEISQQFGLTNDENLEANLDKLRQQVEDKRKQLEDQLQQITKQINDARSNS